MRFYKMLNYLAFLSLSIGLPLGLNAEMLKEEDFKATNPKDGGIFGIELTFTHKEILEKSKIEAGWFGNTYYWNQGVIRPYPLDSQLFELQKQWLAKSEARCTGIQPEDCSRVDRKEMRIYYPDGWFYAIEVDHGVIEITARPLTARGYEKIAERIQRDIFDFAANGVENGLSMNLVPHKRAGDGHMHLDLATNFTMDGQLSALLFRNFFVDFQNHGAMVLGALGNALTNAPLMIEGRTATDDFDEVLRKWDKEMLASKAKLDDFKKIQSFADNVTNLVYKKPFLPQLAAVTKQHALNLDGLRTKSLTEVAFKPFFTSSGSLKTLEIRALPPQKSAREIVMLANLFKTRLEYLRTVGKPIPYDKRNLFTYQQLVAKFPPPHHHQVMYPEEAYAQFYDYVMGAKRNWDEYNLMTPKPKFLPLQSFEQHYLQSLEKYYRLYFNQKGASWDKFLAKWVRMTGAPLARVPYLQIAENFEDRVVDDAWMRSITADMVVEISDDGDAEIFKKMPATPESRSRILMEIELLVYAKKLGLSSQSLKGYLAPKIIEEIKEYATNAVLEPIADYVDLDTPKVKDYREKDEKLEIIEDYKKAPKE